MALDDLPMTPTVDMIRAMPTKRKASKKRPTARTLEALRDAGHIAQVVERWQVIKKHPGGGVRQDLFGTIDVVAIMDGQIVGIQCGAGSGHSGHKKKCLAEPRLLSWINAGGGFFIHSWEKNGPRGKAKRWNCRIEQLTAKDFEKPAELDLFT